jgi:cellulose synthase/poly-beta-1,6-N-acetylglucosamine synthase-like glycosyltransferase
MAGIDIVIPSYNYRRYLADCVASILMQRVDSLRILIIDNASTDGSDELARCLAERDNRIQLRLRSKNIGPHASFNEGVDWAASEYFTILCADDLLSPGSLCRAINIMEQNPDVVMAYGRTEFLAAESSISLSSGSSHVAFKMLPGYEYLEQSCRSGRSPVDGPTTVVRTSAQKQAGHYRTDLPHTDDAEMWMRLACLGSVAEIDAVQVLARIHDANQSNALKSVHHWNTEMERTFAAFFQGPGSSLKNGPKLHRTARNSLAARAYWCALSHFCRGDPGAKDLITFALRMRPSLAFAPPLMNLLQRGDAVGRIQSILTSYSKPH